ncbi:MAG: tetratricopeptide repeat protein [Oligoflexus sp.]
MNLLKLLVISLTILAATSGVAADIKTLLQRKPQKVEDARPGNLSERDYNRLSRAQQMMAEGKFDDALNLLNMLEESTRRDSFGLAQVYQTKGYVYAQNDNFAKAAEYFQKCLDLKALPLQPTLSTMYSLAQVNAAQEKYLEAVPLLQDYLYNRDPPHADAYFFYGQILAQLNARLEAVKQVERAIELNPEPREPWYRLLAALYYEQKNYPKAIVALTSLLNINPDKKEYWQQLSSIYVATNQDDKALATLEVAYKKDFLDEERDLLQLVRLSLFRGVPYKAGVYLEKAIEQGIVEKNKKHYELLADSWIRAQEVDRALAALSLAAPLADDGSVFVRQGQLYLEKEQWQESVKSLEAGIKKGGLSKPGLAYVAMGIAQYRLGRTEASLAAFKQAQKYPQQERQAKEWINHLSMGVADTH